MPAIRAVTEQFADHLDTVYIRFPNDAEGDGDAAHGERDRAVAAGGTRLPPGTPPPGRCC
jgi:hypothetical protein